MSRRGAGRRGARRGLGFGGAPIVLPAISGVPYEGEDLSTTDGTWPSPGDVTYQWQRDTGSGFVDIAGATSSTYTVQSADSGADIRSVVTSGSTSAVSNVLTMPIFTGLVAAWFAATATDSGVGTASALASLIDATDTPAQGTEANRPTLITDDNFGGREVLVAVGSHLLADASLSSALAAAMSSGGNFTVYVVLRHDRAGFFNNFLLFDDGTTGNQVQVGITNTNVIRLTMVDSGGTQSRNGINTIPINDVHGFAVIRNGSVGRIWSFGAQDNQQSLARSPQNISRVQMFHVGWASIAAILIYDAALPDAGLQILDAFKATNYASSLPANTLTRDPVAVAGQSNGNRMGSWGIATFVNVAIDASALSRWEKASADLYPSLQTWIAAQDPGDVWVYWVHGEQDSTNEALSLSYESRLTQMFADLRADCPDQNVKLVVLVLNNTINAGTFPFWANVRNAHESVIAATQDCWGVYADDITLTNAAGRDGVHYGTTDDGVCKALRARMDAERMRH